MHSSEQLHPQAVSYPSHSLAGMRPDDAAGLVGTALGVESRRETQLDARANGRGDGSSPRVDDGSAGRRRRRHLAAKTSETGSIAVLPSRSSGAAVPSMARSKILSGRE